VVLQVNETRYVQTSPETNGCIDDSARLTQAHSCVDARRFFTSLNSLAIMLVTSSSGGEPHDSVSSIVDCASDSDDNRIIGSPIRTATKARLYDLDMLFHCRVTCSTDYGSFMTLI